MSSLKESKIVGLKEIVIVVLLGVLIIIVNIVTAIPFMTSPKWSVWGGYGLATLISGPIFILMISKAPKVGTNFLFFIVKALQVFIMGQVPTTLVYLLGGVICELIMLKDGYRNPFRVGISYAVHSVIFGIGTFTPIFLGADAYAEQMLASGMDEAMVNSMIYGFVKPSFVLISTVILIVASILGVLLGMKMMKKHFKPAGVV